MLEADQPEPVSGEAFREIIPYETRGYIYLWWWDKSYSFKRAAGPTARWILIVLVILEFAAIPLHKWDLLHSSPEWVKWSVVSSLGLATLLLNFHHRILENKVKRYQQIIAGIRLISVEAAVINANSGPDLTVFLTKALETLSNLLQDLNRAKPRVAATLLLLAEADSMFSIVAQYPSDGYEHGLKVHGTNSAAGRILNSEPDSTLYIPWTPGRHGVRIETDLGGKCRHTKLVPNALQRIPTSDRDRLPLSDDRARRSLLCVRVPLEEEQPLAQLPCRAVLCVETNRRSSLGDVEFVAAQMFGSLIAHVLRRSSPLVIAAASTK